MFSDTKTEVRPPNPGSTKSSSSRPRTFFQRASSGLNSLFHMNPLPRAVRPKTAPDLATPHVNKRRNSHLPTHDNTHRITPQITIPKLSEHEQICPDDSNRYHSFPPIESSYGDLCGLPVASRASSTILEAGRPCSDCRTRSRLSHMAFTFKSSRQKRHNVAMGSYTAMDESRPPSSHESPRVVSINTTTRRKSTSSKTPPLYPTHNKDLTRPISPKLHHIHGLPHPNDHPYVHKHEVEQHFAALRAGSSSPLHRSDNGSRAFPGARESPQDYSRTVFYGQAFAPPDPLKSRIGRAISPTEGQQRRILVMWEEEGSKRVDVEEETLSKQTVLHGDPTDSTHIPVHRPPLKDSPPGSLEDIFNPTTPPASPPLPNLRGGASSSTWTGKIRLPQTLFWLAGGKGTSIPVHSWRNQRGRKRMGGLLGLAVYGTRAGVGYGRQDESESVREFEVEVRVGVGVTSPAEFGECADLDKGLEMHRRCLSRNSETRKEKDGDGAARVARDDGVRAVGKKDGSDEVTDDAGASKGKAPVDAPVVEDRKAEGDKE